MNDTLKLVQVTSGLSDTVLLAIIGGLVGIATLIINGRIDAKAKRAEAIAAAEALKVSQKLEAVEVKIDGRLTEILELTRKEAEERGQRMGKEQAKEEEKVKAQETPLPITSADLNIAGGVIKIAGETKKKQ